MKEISIQELKGQLSAAIAEAESGSTILITRHGRPAAQLAPAGPQHTHIGPQSGTRAIEPLLIGATGGRYLAVLLDDRRGADEA